MNTQQCASRAARDSRVGYTPPRDGTTTGDGVLVYSVDASVPSGRSPVRIVPAKTTTSPIYGELFEAPFSSDSILDEPTLPFSLSIKAKREDGCVVALKVR